MPGNYTSYDACDFPRAIPPLTIKMSRVELRKRFFFINKNTNDLVDLTH